MRVLHIGKYFPPRHGGIETFMSQLMEEQVAQGIKVGAIVHADKLQSCEGKYEWNGCLVYEVKSYGQLIFAPVAPAYPFRLKRTLKEFKPDIIHVHMPNLSAFWLLLLRSQMARLIVHWHSDVLGASPSLPVKLLYPFYSIFEEWLLRKADRVIATSPDYLSSSQPLREFIEKSLVIPLGIKLSSVKFQSNKDNSVLNLVMIGRLTYYKNHDVVISAIEQLIEKNIPIKMNIIGKGELEAKLRKRVDISKRLTESINFTGSVSELDKNSMISEADLLLLPSKERTEAFGMVLLEAANHSKPVLVSDVYGSGMSYVVENNKNGLIISANDARELADNLHWCLNNKDILHEMGEANYRRLKDNFDIRVVATKTSQLYGGVVLNRM